MPKQTECGWWCRHHATTRGWEDEEQRESGKPLFAHVMDENARLKARCHEARDFVDFIKQFAGTPVDVTQEYGWKARAWLEADDA